jgi:hypothetical protein
VATTSNHQERSCPHPPASSSAPYEAAGGKTELLDDVITDDWDDIPLAPGQEPGRAGARSLIEGFSKVFTDLRVVVEQIIDARGDDGNGDQPAG